MINRVLGIQLLVAIVVSAIAALSGVEAGFSALLGGLIGWIANAYFLRKVIVEDTKGPAQRLLIKWYVAEFIKISMTAVLLAVAYALFENLNALALIGGFFLTYVGGAFASAGVLSKFGTN